MKRKYKLIVLTASIVLLGFLRGYLFGNINWIYLTLVNGRMNAARDEFQFLMAWTPGEINLLKWGLTAFFVIAFFGLTYLIINIAFKNKQFNRIAILVYAVLIAMAVVLLAIGKLTGQYDQLYGIIRTIMGITQSFMPLMILVVLFKFLPVTKSN